MATIREIATLVGVSTATVSRVINEPNKVAPETVTKVKTAINELNYKKKVPLKKRSNTFAIIVPNITNPFFSELLDVIEEEAYHHGRCVLFFNSRHYLRQEKIYFSECASHQVDGVFLVPITTNEKHLQQLKEFNFPTVLLTKSVNILPSVAVDHSEGGRLVAKHLLSSGHTQIAYIGLVDKKEDKLKGFENYLSEHREPLQSQYMFNYVANTDLTEFLKSLIKANGEPKVSAIFCMNDVTAQQVTEILTYLKIKVPTEITVIGFDNSLTAKLLNMSSISQPMREIAHLGFETMLECLKETEKQKTYQPKVLLPRLILRNSVLTKTEK